MYLINRLALTVEKQYIFYYQTKKLVPHQSQLLLFNSVIEKKCEMKVIGLFINDKLSWKSKLFGSFSRASESLAISRLKSIYHGFKYQHFLYGKMLWGKVVEMDFDGLVKLQKKAVRLLYRSPRLSHTYPIFHQNEFLKSSCIMIFEMCKFIHHDLY